MFNSGGLGDGPEMTIGDDALGDHEAPSITNVSNQGFAVGATTLAPSSTDGLGTVRIYRYGLDKSPVGSTIELANDGDSEEEFSGNQGELDMIGTKDNRLVAVYTNRTPDEIPQREIRILKTD